MPVDHYENFPVASWLLPAPMREPVEALYHFARGADDIADEGDLSNAVRLYGLERYSRALDEIQAGIPQADAPFKRLAAAVASHDLPLPLLRALLHAFRQDVSKHRYATFDELTDYASRSANPVGRLVLHIFEKSKPGTDPKPGKGALGVRLPTHENSAVGSLTPNALSDLICTGLQLANFWQDVAVDWKKGRIYIPREDLVRFHVEERDIQARNADDRWARLMAFECERTRAMLKEGAPLGRMLPGRLGLEIRATVQGGLAILDKIDAVKGDVFTQRPKLNKWDWARILAKAL